MAGESTRTRLPAGWGVYLLRCADGTLYCGVTTDIDRRLAAHNTGKAAARYTRARRPVQLLLFTGAVLTRSTALRLEARIKRLPRQQKIRTLLQAVLP